MIKITPRYYGTLILSLLWLLAVILFYYWIHKPITPAFARSIGGAMLDIASSAFFVIVAGGIGRWLVDRFFPDWAISLSTAERLAGEALLGLGFLSTAILAIGMIRLSRLTMILLFLAMIMLTWFGMIGWVRDLWTWRRGDWRTGLGIFILLNLIMALIMSIAPPTAFDTQTYHLVGAKLWLIEGRFVSLEGNHFFGFPQLVNTLYAAQMTLLGGRLTAAASLHAMFGMLALLAVGGYGSRVFKAQVGLTAAAILLTAPSIWLQFSWAYVDLASAAYGMMTFIAFDQWRQKKSPGWLTLAAIFVGLAMAVKYTSLGWGIAGGLYLVAYWRLSPKLWRDAAIYIGIASLVLLPWLLRNWLFYDNPVYPFGKPTGEWDALTDEWYTNADAALLKTNPLWVIFLPITSTFLGVEGGIGFSATIGPLFLLLIPFLLMTYRHLEQGWKTAILSMLTLIIGTTLFWMITAGLSVYGAQTRLVYTMFPLLSLLAAVALDSLRILPRNPLDFAWIVRVMVGLIFVLTLTDHFVGKRPESGRLEGTTLNSHFLDSHALEYLTGVMSRDQYLEANLGTQTLAIKAVNKLPEGSKVLFLWETRSLYCDEPHITCVEDSILHRWWHSRRTIGTPVQILESWRKDGITHVLAWEDGREYESGNKRYTDADKNDWETMRGLLTEIWSENSGYILYEVR